MNTAFGFPMDFEKTGILLTFIITVIMFIRSFSPQKIKFSFPKEERDAFINQFDLMKMKYALLIENLNDYKDQYDSNSIILECLTINKALGVFENLRNNYSENMKEALLESLKTKPMIEEAMKKMFEEAREIVRAEKDLAILRYHKELP